jgi:hypothetical protein
MPMAYVKHGVAAGFFRQQAPGITNKDGTRSGYLFGLLILSSPGIKIIKRVSSYSLLACRTLLHLAERQHIPIQTSVIYLIPHLSEGAS